MRRLDGGLFVAAKRTVLAGSRFARGDKITEAASGGMKVSVGEGLLFGLKFPDCIGKSSGKIRFVATALQE